MAWQASPSSWSARMAWAPSRVEGMRRRSRSRARPSAANCRARARARATRASASWAIRTSTSAEIRPVTRRLRAVPRLARARSRRKAWGGEGGGTTQLHLDGSEETG